MDYAFDLFHDVLNSGAGKCRGYVLVGARYVLIGAWQVHGRCMEGERQVPRAFTCKKNTLTSLNPILHQ